MSALCHKCPACGSADVRTRLVHLAMAECKCRQCSYAWQVAIEAETEAAE